MMDAAGGAGAGGDNNSDKDGSKGDGPSQSGELNLELSSGTVGTKKADPPREPDYDWGRTLGEGTFGEVKEATLKKTGQKFAIKKIKKDFLKQQKKNKDVVFKERQILSVLDHPLVVRLHYTFQNPDYLFFVMDYCPNGELFTKLKELGSLNVECTRFFVAEMVIALEYINSKGVIHRDFKPENILLTESGHIKVIDFGTAKQVHRERTGSFEGTPEYMSPELASTFEGGTTDWRCDLWSLGVIVYQCITGRLPFRGGSPWETLRMIREGDMIWPAGFPEDALDFCKKLMVPEDERLGAKGFDEIKKHPFFVGIDWENLLTSTPPPIEPMKALPVFPAPKPKVEDSDSDLDEEIEDSGEKEVKKKKGSGILDKSTSGDLSLSSSDGGGIERWDKLLNPGEKIVKSSSVLKKRRFMNVKKRQLILTDTPRLLYVDPVAMTIQGTIAFTNLNAVAKNKTHFIIKTPGRDYNFEDKNKGAEDWVKAINAAT